jgi:hypothetical protein
MYIMRVPDLLAFTLCRKKIILCPVDGARYVHCQQKYTYIDYTYIDVVGDDMCTYFTRGIQCV